MIESLEGTLTSKNPTMLTVEVGGVGFLVQVPLSTSAVMPEPGRRVRLLTHLHVREDQLRLFGFATETERRLFLMLIGVNRVGPAVALHALSSCSVEDFTRYVMAGDVEALATLVRGVGKKTAQRLVLELRGELAQLEAEPADALSPAAADAVKGLVSLGESPASARKAVQKAVKKLGPDAGAEALMREALSG
jgi:Holliday junction DNA helicase RuvA